MTIMQDQVDDPLAEVDAEAAATPTGPCPPWCELAAGHPFKSSTSLGEQFRYHERYLSEHVRIVAIERYVGGIPQAIADAVVSVDSPDGDLDLMPPDSAAELAGEIQRAAIWLKHRAAEADGSRATQEQVAARQRAADAEAAATPVGPCPEWCEKPAGHPFEADNNPGFQYRKHERVFGRFASIWFEEEFLAGAAQPSTHPKVNIFVPDDTSDMGMADAAAIVRELVSAIAVLSRIEAQSKAGYDIFDGPTVADRSDGIHPAWCDRLDDPNHLGINPVDPPCMSHDDLSGLSVSTWIDAEGHRKAVLNMDYDEIPVANVWQFIEETLAAVTIFDPAPAGNSVGEVPAWEH